MIKCVIYARVSSEEQAAEGKTSIQTQLDDCRAHAAKLGWAVVGEFTDDKKYRVGKKMVEPSGTRSDRPAWRRMLGELAAGRADALISWHSSRLYRAYRPMVDFLEIIEARPIQVQLVKDSFDVRFAVLQAWLGKEENKARVERTYFGHVGRAKKGLPATRQSSFFKKVIEPATGEKLGYEFDEQYRAIFDTMARLFLQRVSYRDIALRLGPNPLTGRAWSQATIIDILNNPLYRGMIEFGRRSKKGVPRFTVAGRHKPVWDETTCAGIEAELARRTAAGPQAPRSKTTPFAGVLRCGYCGRPMSASRPGERLARDGRSYRYYTCHRNRLVRHGYEQGIEHVPNGISELKLLSLIRSEFAAVDEDDLETVLALLASQLPARRVDDSLTRGQLAEVERKIAEMEPDLERVKSPGARAIIDADLTALKEQAALYKSYLAANGSHSTINLDDFRAAWLELKEHPERLDMPDLELKAFIARTFPVLYVAGGEIVGPPDIQAA